MGFSGVGNFFNRMGQFFQRGGAQESDRTSTGRHIARHISRAKHSASKKMTRVGESLQRKAARHPPIPTSGPGSGLVKRAKTDISMSEGSSIRFRNPAERDAVERMTGSFHQFDVVPRLPFDKPPLTQAQFDKARELVQDPPEGLTDPRGLMRLIDLQGNPRATRNDFDRAGWEALDLVNFELTKEHMSNLCDLFNSGYHSATAREFQEQFEGGDWNESLVAETLAKALAYTEGLDGKTLQLPVRQQDGSYELKEFHVSKHTLGNNLPCYVLTREGETSWVVARGTEIVRGKTEGESHREGAMESILADCEPEGIGYSALGQSLRDGSLGNILDEAGPSFNIAGHSLGGLLANEIAARYPDQVSHCYGFSAPGISENTYGSLDADQLGELSRKVTNFQTEGDLIPSAGRYLVGTNVAVSSQAADATHAHLEHNLNKPRVQLTLIDNDQENQKLMRRVSESTRRGAGGAMLKIASLVGRAPRWYGGPQR